MDSLAGRRRVAEHLATEPFPHFEPADGKPGFPVRIDADDACTLGRFVNGRLEPVESRRKARR